VLFYVGNEAGELLTVTCDSHFLTPLNAVEKGTEGSKAPTSIMDVVLKSFNQLKLA